MNKAILIFLIIIVIGIIFLPNIIINIDAKHLNKSLTNHNIFNKEILLGTIEVFSNGNQNDLICNAFKNYEYNFIDISRNGEQIDFLVDVNIHVKGWFDLGTAIVSIADNAKTESYDDYIDTTWRFSLWCTQGKVIPYTITAMLSDINFDPIERSDTEMGAISCSKSFFLFSILLELQSKMRNIIKNEFEKFLIKDIIQFI